MANHAYVTTKKKMTPALITEMLNRLNQERFRGILKIEYSDETGNKSAWGPHVWLIKIGENGEFGSRVCWLNTGRKFEIRHGGGGDFIWWVDISICNEIAVLFNGKISDDGGDGKWDGAPNKYKTWADHFARIHKLALERHKDTLPFFKQMFNEEVPPEFQNEDFQQVLDILSELKDDRQV